LKIKQIEAPGPQKPAPECGAGRFLLRFADFLTILAELDLSFSTMPD
jgi:hypothetical protein